MALNNLIPDTCTTRLMPSSVFTFFAFSLAFIAVFGFKKRYRRLEAEKATVVTDASLSVQEGNYDVLASRV